MLLIGALLLLSLYLRRGGAARTPSEDDLLARPSLPRNLTPRAEEPSKALSPPGPSAEPAEDGRTLWQKRLARAQQTLDAYLEATHYPPTSRPLAEHPDLVQPHFVSDQKVRLKRRDDKLTDARATLRQDRYYVVGDERVTFGITCENSDGPARCEVLSTMARAGATAGDAAAPSDEPGVPFTAFDSGALTATFQPSTQGFAGVFGPIRLFVDLRVDGEEGQVSFEVMFTPAPPAVFTGVIREALTEGSLDLNAELKVDKPGRYVITARADDADGRGFAYLSFNEELGAGRQEARLRVFGKLVHDQKARAPFHLRDVEGFLLREDAYPDRELMPSLLGDVHATRRYAERDFSDKDWQSDEKDRHIQQLTADVEEAKGHAAGGE